MKRQIDNPSPGAVTGGNLSLALTREKCSLYNYADDNTLAYIHKKLEALQQILVTEGLSLIQWFENNFMKAYPDKFQAMCVGKRTFDAIKSFQLGDTKITCEEKVSLLGVTIDVHLNFKDHISHLYKSISTACCS